MNLEEAKELHAPVVKKFSKRRIICKGIDDLWAADTLIMSQYSDENNGFKYILNVIDTFSKYVWSVPMKTKSATAATEAFENIIIKSNRKPNLLHVDMGTEFVNKKFETMLKKYDIKMYHTYNEEKSSIVERFHRTLNQKLRVYFEANDNFKWYKILPKLIEEYNTKDVHRTIGMRPVEVNENNEEDVLIRINKLRKVEQKKPKFQVGDRVRIFAYKNTFQNKYKNNWTREIFLVDKIFYTNPITYSLKDLEGEEVLGKFYDQELLKSKY